ncbi:unnamed protein product, partial [Porites evermanni]
KEIEEWPLQPEQQWGDLLKTDEGVKMEKATVAAAVPRSQSSSAIWDASPVKLVGKIHTRFQASSGNSDSANWPRYEAVFIPKPWRYTISKDNLNLQCATLLSS